MYPPDTIYGISHIYISPFAHIFTTRHISIINLFYGVSSSGIYVIQLHKVHWGIGAYITICVRINNNVSGIRVLLIGAECAQAAYNGFYRGTGTTFGECIEIKDKLS